MICQVSIMGVVHNVLELSVAGGTFLGKPGDPDEKPTYVILTEKALYVGPSLSECRRMLNAKGDKASIHFADQAPPMIVKNIGDLYSSLLGNSNFR